MREKRELHLGRLVFLLAAVESADPAPAALEDAISESESVKGLVFWGIQRKLKNPRNRKLRESV